MYYLYCDGSALANGHGGKGGFGIIIKYTKENGDILVKEFGCGYASTTNNRMEILALMSGLTTFKSPSEITVVSDSQYVINTLTKGWLQNWQKNGWKNANGKDVKNKDLWEMMATIIKPHKISYQWVKGHSGHPENESCDKIAKNCANSGTRDDKVIKLPFTYDHEKSYVIEKEKKTE